ncbi:hypothetical protein Tco_0797514 [Tanacetum coccineum]
MLAICAINKPVVKAHKTSSKAEKKDSKGKKPRAKTRSSKIQTRSKSKATKHGNPSQPPASTPVDVGMHKKDAQAAGGPTSLGVTSEEGAHPQLSSGTNLNVLADKTNSVSERLEIVLTTLITGKGASTIAKQLEEVSFEDTEVFKEIKLKDLSKLVQNAQADFMDLDSTNDDPIIVVVESEEDDEEDNDEEVHATSNSQNPKLEQLKNKVEADVALLLAKPTFPNVEHLNELLTLQWELPVEFLSVPTQVETVQAKLKTLDALPSSKVESSRNKKLKKFDFVTKDGDHIHLSKEQIKAQKKIKESTKAEAAKHEVEVRKEELVDLFGPDVVSKYYKAKLQYNNYCDKMPNRRAKSRITNCDVLTRKGPITLKVYIEYGTSKVIPNFKASDLHLGEWREVVKACPNRKEKGCKQYPLNKLNDLANKKRKHADDIHDYFRANKRLKPSVQYEDHLARTVLNEPVLGPQDFPRDNATDADITKRSTETFDRLAAIQAQLNTLGREIKKLNEKVYATQVGYEQRKGPHYTKDCPLKKEGKTLEEAYYTQFGGPFQGGGYRATSPEYYQRNNANPSYQE